IQMGEARYRNGLNDSYKEGLEKGREEGIKEGKEAGERLILNQLIENIYHEDATTWLQSLTIEQLNSISRMILSCDTFDELKKYVYNSL
ncbi:MAG: hypothetical protein ACLRQU_17840, partial [Clostridium sp.]